MAGEQASNEESDVLEFKNGGEHVTFTNASGSKRGVGRLENVVPSLETDAEYRARKRSHWVIYTTTFVMSIGFSIILTGVWPYLQKLDPEVSKEYLGWVIAANPLGQMVMSPVIGFWATKLGSNRPAFFFTVCLFIIGNALYSILSVFGSSAKIMMIISRLIVGISSANITLCRSYIAASSTLRERTTAVSLTSAAQSLGFVIGPALQTAIAVSFSHSSDNVDSNCTMNDFGNSFNNNTESKQGIQSIEWDMFTAAGWIASLLGFVNLVLFLPCIFKEYNIAEKEANILQQQRKDEEKERKLPRVDYPAVIIVLGAFFTILLVFVLLETIAVPMVIDMYAWTSDFAITVVGIGMSIIAIITLFMFGLGSILARKYDERKVMIFLGLVPTMLSMFIHIPMGSNYAKMQNCTTEDSQMTTFSPLNITASLVALNSNNTEESALEALSRQKRFAIDDGGGSSGCSNNHNATSDCHLGCPQNQEWCLYTPIVEIWQMALADLTAVIGYPVAFAILSSIYSKILGPKPQGVWMGILTSVGSFSRVIGPIFVSYMYTELGTRWTFGSLFTILALNVAVVSLFYNRLVPMKVDRGEQAEPLQD